MILRDAIGNTIKKGDTLYWKSKDLFVKVTDVFQPEPKAPGGLMVVMALPLEGKSGENVQLPEFVRTVNPQSEAVLEAFPGPSAPEPSRTPSREQYERKVQ